MRKYTLPTLLVLFAIFLLFPGPVGAQDAPWETDVEIGSTLFRLGRDERAVVYLERARSARPDDPDVLLPLGISLSRLGRHREAVDILSAAPLRGPLAGDAAFFLGKSWEALGDREKAHRAYSQAARLRGPLGSRALIEAGKMAMSAGDLVTAQQSFERLLQLESAGALADEARAGIADIQRRRAQQKLALSVDAGLRYDSNVLLLPASTADADGWRAVVNAQGRYALLETKPFRAEIAAGINQGRYFKPVHQPFDLGVHNLRLDGQYRIGTLPVRIGLGLGADYWTLDFNYYKRAGLVTPRLMVAEGSSLATSLAWQWRADDYAFDGRDSVNRRTELTQFFFWGRTNYLGLGGSYEQNRSQDDYWKYDLAVIRLFGGGEVGAGLVADAAFDFALTPYLAQPVDRTDQALTLALGLSRWWGSLGARLSGAWTNNENLRAADITLTADSYAKVLVGADVRWQFP